MLYFADMKRNAIQISRNLFEKAKVIADVEHRSTAKQIEYWAKLGKMCSGEPRPRKPVDLAAVEKKWDSI